MSGAKLNFEAASRKLMSPSLAEGLQCATDLRERIEIVHSAEYANFLRAFFPVFRELLLNRLGPDHAPDSHENRFRHVVLEILNRLPNNEVLRPYTPELLRIATETLGRDNEENALTSLRIIFDLHKNFRPALEREVQTFLDLVKRIYSLLPEAVKRAFASTETAAMQEAWVPSHKLGSLHETRFMNTRRDALVVCKDVQPPNLAQLSRMDISVVNAANAAATDIVRQPTVLRGTKSFKVLTECPLIVMLLFQLYPKYIQENIPRLTPLMMNGLALRAPTVARTVQRERYTEFVACQVKTLSFLTYLLRGFLDLMKPYEGAISHAVIALLISCPGDAVSTRKELLVATRHILATEFRGGFFKHVDILLDEDVLVGVGRQSQESLRPLAYSTLADLVHHVRSKLTLDQLTKVVVLFARNLQDSALPLAVQTTSVRLLLNLVDFIFHNVESNVAYGKSLLVCIMRALVTKFDTLRVIIRRLCSSSAHNYTQTETNAPPGQTPELMCLSSEDTSGIADCTRTPSLKDTHREHKMLSTLVSASPLLLYASVEPTDDIREIKALLQTMLRGLKTVIWCISHERYLPSRDQDAYQQVRRPLSAEVSSEVNTNVTPRADTTEPSSYCAPQQPMSQARRGTYILTCEEANAVAHFFEWGMSCCQECTRGQLREPEIKEILDNFAGAFTVLDGFNLRISVGRHIPLFFECMLNTPQLIAVAQLLLANTNASTAFADMLLSFLVTKLGILAHMLPSDVDSCCQVPLTQFQGVPTPSNKASLVLKLHKIVIGSVTLFVGHEAALHGHLRFIVLKSAHYAMRVRQPAGFILLLRALFRSLSNVSSVVMRKLHRCYDEIESLLPLVIDAFLKLRQSLVISPVYYQLLTEIILMLPVRQAALSAYTSKIVPVVVAALNDHDDLASVSLRTVERYVDQLGASHLVQAFCEIEAGPISLMSGISRHLRPEPYLYGTVALRILGKLGGNNLGILLSKNFVHPCSVCECIVDIDATHALEPACMSLVPRDRESTNPQSAGLLTFLFRWTERASTSTTLKQPPFVAADNIPGFTFRAAGCIAVVCELFYRLLSIQSLVSGDTSRAQSFSPGTDAQSMSHAAARRYSSLCFHFLATSLCCIQFDDMHRTLMLGAFSSSSHRVRYYREIHETRFENRYSPLSGPHENVPASELKALLSAMLVAVTVREISDEARRLIDGACQHIVALIQVQPGAIGGNGAVPPQTDVNLHPHSVLGINSTNLFLQVALSPSLFIHALIEALVSSSRCLQRVAIEVLCALLHLASHELVETSEYRPSNMNRIVNEILSHICLRFCDVDAPRKDGLCRALLEILPVSARFWDEVICIEVVTSLLKALRTCAVPISINTTNLFASTMCSVLSYLAMNTHLCCGASLLRLLLRSLASRHPAVRLVCQCALIEQNLVAALPPLSSASFPEAVICSRGNYLLRSLQGESPIGSLLGTLDALTFFMAADPPAVTFDDILQNEIRGLIEEFMQTSSLDKQGCHCSEKTHPAVASRFAFIPLGWNKHIASFSVALNVYMLHASLPRTSPQTLLHVALIRTCHAGLSQHAVRSFGGDLPCSALFVNCVLNFACYGLNSSDEVVLVISRCLLQDLITTTCASLCCDALTVQVSSLLHHLFAEDHPPLSALQRLENVLAIPGVNNILGLNLMDTLMSSLRDWQKKLQSHTARNRDSVLFGIYLLRLLAIYPVLSIEDFSDTGASRSQGLLVEKSIPLNSKVVDLSLGRAAGLCAELVALLLQVELDLPAIVEMHPTGTLSCHTELCNGSVHGFNFESQFYGLCAESGWSRRCRCEIPASPFRPLLACFMSRYALAATLYILHPDTLSDHVQVTFLRSLITLPQANYLRTTLLSAQGAALLLRNAFSPSFGSGTSNHDGKILIKGSRIWNLPLKSFYYSESARGLAGMRHVGGYGSLQSSSDAPHGMDSHKSHGHVGTIRYHGLQILRVLHRLDSRFIQRNAGLLHCLRTMWRLCVRSTPFRYRCKNRRDNLDQIDAYQLEHSLVSHDPSLRNHKEMKLMLECLVPVKECNLDVSFLFELLAALRAPSPVDLAQLTTFFSHTLPKSLSPLDKSAVFVLFTRLLVDTDVSSDLKILAVRYIIMPISVTAPTLHMNSKRVDYRSTGNSETMFKSITTFFMRTALDLTGKSSSSYPEGLRVQLLKLTTVLIEQHGLQLIDHRKELIKFAWNHLKSEDALCRQWAYVNVCRFIATYETPPKIILQVFVALLRHFQPESRNLVRLALDVLSPALPVRLPPLDFVKAIKWTKKITYEEGHALPQLIHIWQLIVRHPSLFFQHRAQFLPQMVNSLNRLGLPPNCPVENRELAVSLADLIISWEIQGSRVTSPAQIVQGSKIGSSRDRANVRSQPLSQPANVACAEILAECGTTLLPALNKTKTCVHDADAGLNSTMIDMLTNFLVRLALFSSDNKELMVQRLADVCVAIFRVALRVWPDAHIRFSYFEKLIATSLPQRESAPPGLQVLFVQAGATTRGDPKGMYSPALLSTCLDIIIATLDAGSRPNTFLIDNIYKAQHLIFRCFEILNEAIHVRLRVLLKLVVMSYPPSLGHSSLPVYGLYSKLNMSLEGILRAASKQWQHHAPGHVDVDEAMEISARDDDAVMSDAGRSGSKDDSACSTAILLPALLSLEAIGGQSHCFVVNHSGLIIQLAFTLAQIHLNPMNPSRSPERQFVHHPTKKKSSTTAATPVMAVLAHGLERRNRPDSALTLNLETDDSTAALRKCISVMASAIQWRSLPHLRRPLVALFFACVENSGSIPLLSSICLTVTQWIGDSRSLLSQGEKVAFLESLGDLDRLPEMASQPIISHYLSILHRVFWCCSTRGRRSHTAAHEDVKSIRPYAAGMLAPHAGMRSEFVTLFMCRGKWCVESCLRIIFTSDWSHLSNRFWLIVVVDVLLDSVEREQGIVLATDRGSWIRVGTNLRGRIGSARADLDTFQSSVTWYCRSNACIVSPLKEIAHAHVKLAKYLINELLPAARMSTTLMANVISQQISSTQHSASLQVPAALSSSPLGLRCLDISSHTAIKESFLLPSIFKPRSGVHHVLEPVLTLNVPNTLLSVSRRAGFILSLNPETFMVLAQKYNSRHEVVHFFEKFQFAASGVSIPLGNGTLPDHCLQHFQILSEVLGELGESDLRAFLSSAVIKDNTVQRAIGLECYGHSAEAQALYYHAISHSCNLDRSTDLGKSSVENYVPCFSSGQQDKIVRLNLYENKWIECSRELSQWNLLNKMSKLRPDVASSSYIATPRNQEGLALEAAWKTYDWERTRMLLARNRRKRDRDAQLKLHEIRLAIVEGRLEDVDSLCSCCIDTALERWSLMPRLETGSVCHFTLLHLFHQLVEVHESAELLRETRERSRAQEYPNLLPVTQTWRNRLPELCSSVPHWEDVMCWREYCLRLVHQENEAWASNEGTHILHDALWTMVMLARVSRKHGIPLLSQVGIPARDNMRQINWTLMSPEDIFIKSREEIVACLTIYSGHSKDKRCRSALRRGLRMLEDMNMASFTQRHRAEWCRLQGVFLCAIGEYSQAHSAFSRAVSQCESHGRAWFAWAVLCDSQSTDSGDKLQPIASLSCGRRRPCVSLAHYALACYLNAVEFGSPEASVNGIARVLCLLQSWHDDMHIQKMLSNKIPSLPAWIWVPWMNQLQYVLAHSELNGCRCLLIRVVSAYPQAIVYFLRATLLDYKLLRLRARRISGHCVNRRAGLVCTYPFTLVHSKQPWASHAQAALANIRISQPALAHVIDFICMDLVLSLASSPHERLQNIVEESLLKWYDGPDQITNVVTNVKSRSASQLKQARFNNCICRVNEMFMSTLQSLSLLNNPETRGSETPTSRLRGETMDTASNPCGAVAQLEEWRLLLRWLAIQATQLRKGSAVSSALTCCNIESITTCYWRRTFLAEPASNALEIPGQYCNVLSRPRPELHALASQIDPFAEVRAQNHVMMRQLDFSSLNGRRHTFLCRERMRRVVGAEERTVQFLAAVDLILSKSILAQKRRLRLAMRKIVPLCSRIFIASGRCSCLTLGDTFALHCFSHNKDATTPMLCARRVVFDAMHKCLSSATPVPIARAVLSARTRAHLQIVEASAVPSTVLPRYVQAVLASVEVLWLFRTSFAVQQAAVSAIGHTMAIGENHPHNLMFCPRTNVMIFDQFRLTLYPQCSRAVIRDLPFRLTPNILSLIGPLLLRSTFIRAIGLTMATLKHELSETGGIIKPLLLLLLRNESASQKTYAVMGKKCGFHMSLVFDEVDYMCMEFIQRVSQLSPGVDADSREHPESTVTNLVQSACAETLTSKILPSWQPWL